jgi:hypothetical protein
MQQVSVTTRVVNSKQKAPNEGRIGTGSLNSRMATVLTVLTQPVSDRTADRKQGRLTM